MCDEALVQGPEQNSSKTLAVTQSPALIMESRTFPLPFSSSLSPARSLSLSKLRRVPLGPQAGSKGVQSLELSLEARSVSVLYTGVHGTAQACGHAVLWKYMICPARHMHHSRHFQGTQPPSRPPI